MTVAEHSGLRTFKADLHLHTCLSPCGDWEMSPRDLILRCREAGLELIAVCDHNSAENAAAAMRAGQRTGLAVLPGMEVCTREEVHILALFEELDQALAMQAFVYAGLPGENQPEVFGYQVVANEDNEVVSENPRLLIGATQHSLEQVVHRTHALGGLSISAHVDRPANGIINQLGFIPPDLALDGVEVSYRVPLAQARQRFPMIGARACITSSDAHFLKEIGRAATTFRMAAASLREVGRALRAEQGRGVLS
ncbi:MAG: PHP domain-containing protein [Desulfobacterales bacterium]|jgi:hypothetical protein|nr:PHP domain-containing protein [Desulfobacterales bacterium]